MSTARVDQGGRPRTQGWAEDPLVTVSLHLRKRQLAALDQRADAVHTSRAALVREAIDGLLTHLSARRATPRATTTTSPTAAADSPRVGRPRPYPARRGHHARNHSDH